LIISLIVALDEKGGIGKDNRLPWHIDSDLKRFKSITMGHHLIMGRKTYETIEKPLPGRTMIIVTHNPNYHPNGCIIVKSIDEALSVAEKNHESEVFIIGGGDIFRQSIDMADKIYLTNIHTVVNADTFFPEIEASSWNTVWCEVNIHSVKDEYITDSKILLRNKKDYC
jgi:dihydrofolate reductase